MDDALLLMRKLAGLVPITEEAKLDKKYLVPAILHKRADGSSKIYPAKRKIDWHATIRQDNANIEAPEDLTGEAGFIDMRKRDEFMTREQASQRYGVSGDSRDNLGPLDLWLSGMRIGEPDRPTSYGGDAMNSPDDGGDAMNSPDLMTPMARARLGVFEGKKDLMNDLLSRMKRLAGLR